MRRGMWRPIRRTIFRARTGWCKIPRLFVSIREIDSRRWAPVDKDEGLGQTSDGLLPVTDENEGRPVVGVRPAGRAGGAGCHADSPVRGSGSLRLQNAAGHLLLGMA